MNRSLEQALLSLLPTHNAELPQPLTELASSLLAQSRNRASTLKAEEEISRPYACAHIACDRLKVQLNLPPIEARPPIPPRIYKRLYNHLDHILPSTATTPSRTRTPSAKLRATTTPGGASPLASKSRPNPSPTKSRLNPPTPSKPPNTTTPSRKPPAATTTTTPSGHPRPADPPLPSWIRPTLRHLITSVPPPLPIGPIVISGVESIATPSALASDAWIPKHLAHLLGALYLFVWRAVVEDMPTAEYARVRRLVAGTLNRAREEAAAPEGWEEVMEKELDNVTLRMNRRGWFEMGWTAGVKDLRAVEERRAAERREEEEGAGGGTRPPVRRADTMFQERYDFLGEGRREAYEGWKEGVLRRIGELEGAGGEAMEVDG